VTFTNLLTADISSQFLKSGDFLSIYSSIVPLYFNLIFVNYNID